MAERAYYPVTVKPDPKHRTASLDIQRIVTEESTTFLTATTLEDGTTLLAVPGRDKYDAHEKVMAQLHPHFKVTRIDGRVFGEVPEPAVAH